MPVVNVGSYEKPVYLVAEVCRVLEGQAARAKLEPSQTASMIAFAVRRPHLNAQSIVTTGRDLVKPDDRNLVSAYKSPPASLLCQVAIAQRNMNGVRFRS